MTSANPAPPSLRRRLAALLYEAVLVSGIVIVVAGVYSVSTGLRQEMAGRHGLATTLFLAVGAYFVWCWTHGGQTLAMKTWQIRLVDAHGSPPGIKQASLRYLAAWLCWLPALALWHGLGWPHSAAGPLAGLAWVVAYFLSSRWQGQRQFWHDVCSGTRLQRIPPSQPAVQGARP